MLLKVAIQNSSLSLPSVHKLREQVNREFDLSQLSTSNEPIWTHNFSLPVDFPREQRVNHFMIKSPVSCMELDQFNNTPIAEFVNLCLIEAKRLGLSIEDRYIYLTLDQGKVNKSQTLRDPGWHIDGLQGEEVPVKKLADFQFIWTNALPTVFAVKPFNIDGIDLSKHNVFTWVSRQIEEKEDTIISFPPGAVVLMNQYHVHRASEAHESLFRTFIRLSFTQTPVTSIKMTVNPSIQYNYKYHQTAGDIPKNLI